MPLKKGDVSYNIKELTKANETKPPGKKRSRDQIIAIAYSAAKNKNR